jgi:uncharacterized secreted protein with C-terminal beta-propeller domain
VTEPRTFRDCAEIEEWRAEILSHYQSQTGVLSWQCSTPQASDPMASTVSGTPAASTNVQEPGVEEPDILKWNGKFLFVARFQQLRVVRLPELVPVQTISFTGTGRLKLILDGSRLVTLDEHSNDTRVGIYKVGDLGLTLEKEYRLPGGLAAARLAGGQLLVATYNYIGFDGPIDIGVACDRILKPVTDGYTSQVTALHRIALGRPVKIESSALVGAASEFYVTEKSLYLIGQGGGTQEQVISKFDWRAEKGPKYLASGAVEGQIRNPFAFHEDPVGGRLYAATTVWNPAMTNRLWVLEEKDHELVQLAVSDDFAPGEDIRSIRYEGSKAFVVTFEKTDPLFIFDLIGLKPRLEGRLEMPGFSAYLHPLSGGRLLGVGYDGIDMGDFSWLGGLKLSRFDVSQPLEPKEIDSKVFGGRYSHSDVSVDHHALFYDPQSGIVTLPVRILKADSNLSPWETARELEFSGAFVLNAGQGVEPMARITHWEWLPQSCRDFQERINWWSYSEPTHDVSRIVKVGENYASVSDFGVKLHSPVNGFATLRELRFSDAGGECTARGLAY